MSSWKNVSETYKYRDDNKVDSWIVSYRCIFIYSHGIYIRGITSILINSDPTSQRVLSQC